MFRSILIGSARRTARLQQTSYIHAAFSTGSNLAEMDASKLIINKTETPKTKLPNDQLKFGNTFTDHMLEIDWNQESGWQNPVISPYHKLEIDPAASVLHYALECFEGMKTYLDDQDRIRLFRPDLNLVRMNNSMKRLRLPNFDSNQYLECLKELLKLEKSWIPKGEGYSLYLRPTAISTHPFLGVGASSQVKHFTIMSPVGPYYPEGFAPVRLLADTRHVRAWPGGTGGSKVGSNYGPTIYPQMLAAEKGFTQVLWLFPHSDDPLDSEVTEVGTMNLFVLWKNKDGEKELVTAPLDGTILPGVTRQSIIELTTKWGEFKVTERKFFMRELVEAIDEGRIIEAFGAGTAAVVSPIKEIHFEGRELSVPLDSNDANAGAGPTTRRVWNELTSIQYGRTPSEWSVVVE